MKNCTFTNIFAKEGGIVIGFKFDLLGDYIILKGNSLRYESTGPYSSLIKFFISNFQLTGSLI